MERNDLVSKVDAFLVTIDRSDYKDAVECYNHWAQYSGIAISDPDIAAWALNYVKRYMETKQEFFDAFAVRQQMQREGQPDESY